MGLEILTMHHRASVSAAPAEIITPPLDQTSKRKINLRLILFILLFIFYLCAGALIFSALEAPEERKYAINLKNYLKNFTKKHKCVNLDNLEILITKVMEATDKGVKANKNVSFANNWSFGQAFFFVGTLVTTVGYGHVSPATQAGKAFTIFYCLLGIPAFLILLSGFVDRLKYPSNRLLDHMTKRLQGIYPLSFIQWLHLIAIFFLLFFTMYVLPATIFMTIEKDWTYLDAFYYCFISLTTIGLGDYIPGDKIDQPNRAMYKIFTTGYLIFGIVCMKGFLAVIYEIPQLQVTRLFVLHDPTVIDEQERLADKKKSTASYTRQIDEDGGAPETSKAPDPTTDKSYQY